MTTKLGSPYQSDCLRILPTIADESVHTLFADPPLNLDKHYGDLITDDLSEQEYAGIRPGTCRR